MKFYLKLLIYTDSRNNYNNYYKEVADYLLNLKQIKITYNTYLCSAQMQSMQTTADFSVTSGERFAAFASWVWIKVNSWQSWPSERFIKRLLKLVLYPTAKIRFRFSDACFVLAGAMLPTISSHTKLGCSPDLIQCHSVRLTVRDRPKARCLNFV